jgi:hypothetical protein
MSEPTPDPLVGPKAEARLRLEALRLAVAAVGGFPDSHWTQILLTANEFYGYLAEGIAPR